MEDAKNPKAAEGEVRPSHRPIRRAGNQVLTIEQALMLKGILRI